MDQLKASQVPGVRAKLLADQGGKCALCGLHCPAAKAVLDHCHSEGFIRGTLHRSCNSLLGKLENNRARYGLGNDMEFAAFLAGVFKYLHATKNKYSTLHPTFKTPEQKRIARNTKARKARATKGTA